MAEDYDNNVSTTGADKEQRDNQKKAERPKKTKEKVKLLTFIWTHIAILGPLIIVVILILFIAGIIGYFVASVGLWVENIKEYAYNLWGDVKGFVTSDNITPKVTKEDQIALAQRIQDMGYDIVGYGFADVEYEYDDGVVEEDETIVSAGEIEGQTNKKIVDINKSIDGRNYLQAYIAQSEAAYVPSIWSLMGFFNSVSYNANNFFSDADDVFSDTERTKTENKNAKAFSAGMINIKSNAFKDFIINLAGGKTLNDMISIDRENKVMKLEFQRTLLIKDVYYFGMEDWTSRYGKPIELFLSLHLGTMMPDLAYDLATEDAFNTKVNIDMQKVNATYRVIFEPDGTEESRIMQEDLEKEYLKIMFGMSDTEIGRFESAGVLDEAFEQLLDGRKQYENYLFNLHDGAKINKRNGVSYPTEEGTNLAEIEQKLLGKKYSTYNIIEIRSVPVNTSDVEDTDSYEEIQEKIEYQDVEVAVTEDKILKYEGAGSSVAQSRIDSSILSGISSKQLEELGELILDGNEESTTFLPRISNVENHWYYSYVNFAYGKANKAKKKTGYVPQSAESTLAEDKLNGSRIILDQTFTDDSGVGGVYYQLCEPEVDGPNNAIRALFKGGSGKLDGVDYDFSGKYYRYDGTRNTALRIANAKANDEGKDTFTFLNDKYNTASLDNEEWEIEKQEVTFATKDEEGNTTYTDAFAALGILENTHTQEAEYVYRNLKDLLIKLEYFSKENFMKPLVQVLLWPVERVGSDNVATEDDSEITKGIEKDENEYGLFLRNGQAVNTGDTIIAPGDATVESVEGNTIKLKFKSLTLDTITSLVAKFGSDYNTPDANIVLDMEMTISGINVNVVAGSTVSRGQKIGTATSEDIRIIFTNIDKSIVDDIETYMYPTYKETIEDDFMNGMPNSSEGEEGVDTTTFDPDYMFTNITENQRKVYDALKAAGATKAGACGAMGNIQQESNFNPNAINSSSGAYGIVQWLGSRRDNLQSWCNSHNYEYNSIDGQIQYFLYELQTPYYSEVWQALTTTDQVLEAADIFARKFEVCTNSLGKRKTYANAFMNQMGGLIKKEQ